MFRMQFDFDDCRLTDLNYVNAALSAMRLSDVTAEEMDGYLAAGTEFDPETRQPVRKTFDYGLDHLTLLCEAEEEDALYTWQIDTRAFAKGEVPDTKAFHDAWCLEHPDRAMRSLTQYAFDGADAFVVLHHERTENPPD